MRLGSPFMVLIVSVFLIAMIAIFTTFMLGSAETTKVTEYGVEINELVYSAAVDVLEMYSDYTTRSRGTVYLECKDERCSDLRESFQRLVKERVEQWNKNMQKKVGTSETFSKVSEITVIIPDGKLVINNPRDDRHRSTVAISGYTNYKDTDAINRSTAKDLRLKNYEVPFIQGEIQMIFRPATMHQNFIMRTFYNKKMELPFFAEIHAVND